MEAPTGLVAAPAAFCDEAGATGLVFAPAALLDEAGAAGLAVSVEAGPAAGELTAGAATVMVE